MMTGDFGTAAYYKRQYEAARARAGAAEAKLDKVQAEIDSDKSNSLAILAIIDILEGGTDG